MNNKMSNIIRNLFLTGMVLLVSCLPQQPSAPKCPGGTSYSDTTKTCASTAGTSQSTVDPTFSGATPLTNPTATTLDTTSTFTVSVYNPKNIVYNVRWFVNLSEQVAMRGLLVYPAALSIAPFAGVGSYSVVAKIVNSSSGFVYDTRTWTLTITYPGVTTINAGTTNNSFISAYEATSPGSSGWSDDLSPPLSAFDLINPYVSVVSALGSNSISGVRAEFYYDGSSIGTICKTSAGSTTFSLSEILTGSCFAGVGVPVNFIANLIDRNVAELGHNLSVKVYDVFSGAQIGVTYLWGFRIYPKELATITANTENVNTIIVYDGGVVGSLNWVQNAVTGINPSITTSNILGGGAGHSFYFYDVVGTTETLIGSVLNTNTVATKTLSDALAAYAYNLPSTDRNTSKSYKIRGKVFDRHRNTQVGTNLDWQVEVRAKPITSILTPVAAPIISITDGDALATWVPAIVLGSTNGGGTGSDSASGVQVTFYDGTDTSTSLVTVMADTTTHSASLTVAPTWKDLGVGVRGTAIVRNIFVVARDVYRNTVIGSKLWTVTVNPKTRPTITAATDYAVTAGTCSSSVGNWTCTDDLYAIDDFPINTPTASQQWYWNDLSATTRISSSAAAPSVTLTGPTACAASPWLGSDCSSGVQVRVYDGNSLATASPITPPTTITTAIVDLHTLATTINNTNPNVNETSKLHFVFTDVYTGLTIGTATWDLIRRRANTPPVVSTIVPTIASFTTVAQDVATAFTFTVADDETSPSASIVTAFTVEGSLANGTNSYPGAGATRALPTCNADTGPGVSCSLTFPSYDDLGPLAPQTSIDVVAVSEDTTVNAASTSATTQWTFNVTEAETAPNITDIVFENTSTAVSTANPTSGSPALATENNTFIIHFNVEDQECDNFKYRIRACVDAACVTPIQTTAIVDWTDVNRTSCAVGLVGNTGGAYREMAALVATAPVRIQQHTVNAASANVFYVIEVQDRTNTGTGLTDSDAAVVTVTNNNPVPIWANTGLSTAVALNVQAGYQFTINPGTITDGNTDLAGFTNASYLTGHGSVASYQWQVADSGGNCGTAAFGSIPGATSAILSWTPPSLNVPASYCFRLCIGDDDAGTPRPANCGGMSAIALWDGGGTGFVVPSNVENSLGTSATAEPELAVWQDHTEALGATKDIFTVARSGTQIRVTKEFYTVSDASASNVSVLLNTDESALTPTPDAPLDISITGFGTKVFVAYRLNDTDAYFPLAYNVARIRCFTRAALADCGKWDHNEINSGIGKIVNDGTNWYLPIIDLDDSNKITVLWDVMTATPSFTSANEVNLSASETLNTYLENVIDSGSRLVIITKNTEYDMSSYSLGSITGAGLGTDLVNASQVSLYPNLFTPSYTKLDMIAGSTRLYVTATSNLTSAIYLRHFTTTGTSTLTSQEHAAGAGTTDGILFSGASASGNAQVKLSFYNGSAIYDSSESPLILVNSNVGVISQYRPTSYPLTATTPLSAARKTINTAVAANTSGNQKLIAITKPFLGTNLGSGGSTGAGTGRSVWINYSNGTTIHQSIVNLDTFDDGTSAASDTANYGISFW
jgi:hypothetical protein